MSGVARMLRSSVFRWVELWPRSSRRKTPTRQRSCCLRLIWTCLTPQKLAAATYWLWGADKLRQSNSPNSIRDPAERAKNVGYGAYSRRLLFELWRLAGLARASLSRIVSPTLIVQSRTDPRIANKVAERALASLGSKEKRLVWIEGAGHIITVDYGREQVFREVREWMDTHVPRLTTTA